MFKLLLSALLAVCFLPVEVAAQVRPTYEWSNHWGHPSGSLTLSSPKIGTDDDGSLVSAGFFWGIVDFNPGPAFHYRTASMWDGYVQKLDSVGNFQWAHRIGGTFQDHIRDIAVAPNGDVVVAGHFQDSMDLDPGLGTTMVTSNGGFDAFIIKFDGNGNFLWGTQTGGPLDDEYYAVTIDTAGNVIVGGQFLSDNMDLDPGSGTLLSGPVDTTADLMIQKLDAAGNFQWGKVMVSSGAPQVNDNTVNAIAADDSGNVYFAGRMNESLDFDPDTGTYLQTVVPIGVGSWHPRGYVCKLSPSGQLVWADITTMPSTGYHSTNDRIDVDGAGNVFVIGYRYNCFSWNLGQCNWVEGKDYLQKLHLTAPTCGTGRSVSRTIRMHDSRIWPSMRQATPT